MADGAHNAHHTMENKTQFDLDHALHDWRATLAGSPAVPSGDLDELESHLRDSVATLQAKGLSPREAFWVATSRLGASDALSGEFGKVNAGLVWLDRALWMVVGVVVMGLLSGLASTAADLATLGIYCGLNLSAGPARIGHLVGPLGLFLNALAVLGLFWWFWFATSGGDSRLKRIGAWARQHPMLAATGVGLCGIASAAGKIGTHVVWAHAVPVSVYSQHAYWHTGLGLLPLLIWPLLLAWLLIRTTPKSVAA
jgi:hypothetical protein